ncbi:PLDc N-terminal domain-containing protein [Candidatus Woesearchaeota archaeon]|nr:PLDc N-terminal domain-containing protein [Candidatus Woesearchaeota archaeon]
MNKKLSVWALMFVILTSFAFANVITEGNRVSVSLLSQDPVKVEPGNYVEVRFNIENLGGNPLKNFEVELLPEYPFSLDSGERALRQYGTLSTGINKYDDQSLTVKWKLRVDQNAIEGDNDLRLRYRFDTTDWIYTEDFAVSVETQETILNVKEITTSPETAIPGVPFDLKIRVSNEADSELRNLKFKLNTSTFVTIGSTDEKYVRILDSGKEQEIVFTLVSEGDASEVVYNVPLEMSYYDNEGNQDSKMVYFGLILLEPPNLVKGIDRSEVVSIGDRGSVSISISNVGVDEVKFIELIMKESEDYEILSSKHIYVGNIDTDDFETADFEIYLDSRKDSVPLLFDLKYKDALNKEFSEEISLDLNTFSSREAKKLGLKTSTNFTSSYISFVIGVFLIIFWMMMLFDLLGKRMPRYKRLIWVAILILTSIFGAIVYYFTARKKK